MSEVASGFDPNVVDTVTPPPAPSPESFLARVKAEVAKIANDVGVEQEHIVALLKDHL